MAEIRKIRNLDRDLNSADLEEFNYPSSETEGHTRINLDPNAVEDAMNDAGERRIFTRVNVSDQKLELKFLNENQFAKQYIENISVGGLLVKTKYKPKLGSFIPVEFSIGQINSTPKIIKLRAKVCRVTGDSIGLEFPDLNRDNRKVVEKFVRSALAPGSSAARQVKKSTLEHLEQMREKETSMDQKVKEINEEAKKETEKWRWENENLKEELRRSREARMQIEREAQELIQQAELHYKGEFEKRMVEIEADAKNGRGFFGAIGKILDTPIIDTTKKKDL
jgi:hypothetical protein